MNDLERDRVFIRELVRWSGKAPAAVARLAGVAATTINRPFNGTAETRIGRSTMDKLREAFPSFPGFVVESDQPTELNQRSYVEVEVLPTFAGLGGGGTGDGDVEYGLVPRSLVEDQLHGTASDFVLVDTRGDSMEPDFFQGDQLLIDKRDRNPVQPGAFALWEGDGYVIKNVERVEQGLRVFATNPKYRERVVAADEINIMGRPVWFGRRI